MMLRGAEQYQSDLEGRCPFALMQKDTTPLERLLEISLTKLPPFA
jgi:hypothetical protein